MAIPSALIHNLQAGYGRASLQGERRRAKRRNVDQALHAQGTAAQGAARPYAMLLCLPSPDPPSLVPPCPALPHPAPP